MSSSQETRGLGRPDARDRSPRRPARVIEATAERLSSSPLARHPRQGSAERVAMPVYEIPPIPVASEPETAARFGRRMAPPADLVFPPRNLPQLRRLTPRDRSPLQKMRDLAEGAPFARRALFACGFLIGLLSVPAVLLTMLGSPNAAPLTAPTLSSGAVDGVAVENAASAITTRGSGAVLTVSGTLRNQSAKAGAVPTLRIALTDEAGRTLQRPFRPTKDRLAPGEALAFSTRIAVPAELKGEIAIRLVPLETASAAREAAL